VQVRPVLFPHLSRSLLTVVALQNYDNARTGVKKQ